MTIRNNNRKAHVFNVHILSRNQFHNYIFIETIICHLYIIDIYKFCQAIKKNNNKKAATNSNKQQHKKKPPQAEA